MQNDILFKQNVCHLLAFKPSESDTEGLWNESGTLENCGYITKALLQRWESFLKQKMQHCNGAYCFH